MAKIDHFMDIRKEFFRYKYNMKDGKLDIYQLSSDVYKPLRSIEITDNTENDLSTEFKEVIDLVKMFRGDPLMSKAKEQKTKETKLSVEV